MVFGGSSGTVKVNAGVGLSPAFFPGFSTLTADPFPVGVPIDVVGVDFGVAGDDMTEGDGAGEDEEEGGGCKRLELRGTISTLDEMEGKD